MKYLGFAIALAGFILLAYLFLDLQKKLATTPVQLKGAAGSYLAALDEAKNGQKEVLLIFTAEWCCPCQQMKHEIYPSPQVSAVAPKYVWYFADIHQSSNRSLVEHFGIHAVPTLIIVDPMGREKTRLMGGRSAESLAGWLARN